MPFHAGFKNITSLWFILIDCHFETGGPDEYHQPKKGFRKFGAKL